MKSKLNVSTMFTEEELAQQGLLEAEQFKAARRANRKSNRQAKRMKLVAYQFQVDPDKVPQVGQSLAIRHRTSLDAKGNASMVRSDIIVRKIKAVCPSEEDGYRVIDEMGEPWLVRPTSLGHAKWESFKPGEMQKVVVSGQGGEE